MAVNRPIIHAAAETLAQSPWVPLTMSTGWAPVNGHAPKVCRVGQIIFLTGAVLRQAGGAYNNIATIPPGYRPSTTQFIGSGVASSGGGYELYTDQSGVLMCASYESAGSKAGIVLPLAAMFIPA